jgi:hypothetical protein
MSASLRSAAYWKGIEALPYIGTAFKPFPTTLFLMADV